MFTIHENDVIIIIYFCSQKGRKRNRNWRARNARDKTTKKSKINLTKILPNPVPVIQEMMVSTVKQYCKAVEDYEKEKIQYEKWLADAPKRDRLVEESCLSSFHKHFNPNCKKTYPLHELSLDAHYEREWALEEYESNRFRINRKKLLKAIPGCSTVLGSAPWEYSDSYSGKQALEIYIYFLSFFLNKHPYDVTNRKVRSCGECESRRSEGEFLYQTEILIQTEGYKYHGCFECRQYFCKECGTKISFKTLYRDLHNTNMFHTIKCERCVKTITKVRSRMSKFVGWHQQKKRDLNVKSSPKRYGDVLYYYIPDE